MPELPEVETVTRDLSSNVVGRSFEQANIFWPRVAEEPAAEELVEILAGLRIERLTRRGKYILFHLHSGKFLIIHLRMTGRLYLAQPGDLPDPFTTASFVLTGGQELRFADQRKFGRIWLVDDPAAVVGKLGPEALDEALTASDLKEKLKARPGANIKALLLDQSFLAGLGNIYADEALFEAGIHPSRRAGSLSPKQVEALYRAIRTVLHKAIKNRGTTFSDYRDGFGRAGRNKESLAVFHRSGECCVRCGCTIQRTVVAGRGTHFCPNCQEA